MPQPIAVCLGSASEAIKLAPVVHELRRRDVSAVVLTAGRPGRMLDAMLATFEIEPDVDVRSAAGGCSTARRTEAAVRALDGALASVRPEAVVVHADTATAFCAAPAAFSRRMPVAQVEAGARAGDLAGPFAGDADRRLLGQLGTWHFAPSEAARATLVDEGIDPAGIEVAPGAAAEAAVWIAARDGLLGRRPPAGPRRVLVAIGRGHDGGTTGRMIGRLAERADVEVVVAAPRSPVLRGDLAAHGNVRLLDSVGYERFVAALATSHLLITDAPSASEAAAAFGVAAVAAGAGARDHGTVLQQAERLLDDDELHRRLTLLPAPPVGGGAAGRIVTRLTGDRRPAPAAGVRQALLAA